MVTNLLFEVIYFTGVFPLAKSVFLMIVPLTAIDRPLPYFVMGIMASIFSVAQIYLVLTLTACLPQNTLGKMADALEKVKKYVLRVCDMISKFSPILL